MCADTQIFRLKHLKKIPAKAIPQAGSWFLWLSNMPHTFTPRPLHSRLHFVPRQPCQGQDTGGWSLPGQRSSHTPPSVGSALCYCSGWCCMWKCKWKLAQTTEFAKPVCLTRAKHEPRTAWFELLSSGYPTWSTVAAAVAVPVLGCAHQGDPGMANTGGQTQSCPQGPSWRSSLSRKQGKTP